MYNQNNLMNLLCGWSVMSSAFEGEMLTIVSNNSLMAFRVGVGNTVQQALQKARLRYLKLYRENDLKYFYFCSAFNFQLSDYKSTERRTLKSHFFMFGIS
jgi:hypothetical protein